MLVDFSHILYFSLTHISELRSLVDVQNCHKCLSGCLKLVIFLNPHFPQQASVSGPGPNLHQATSPW